MARRHIHRVEHLAVVLFHPAGGLLQPAADGLPEHVLAVVTRHCAGDAAVFHHGGAFTVRKGLRRRAGTRQQELRGQVLFGVTFALAGNTR